MVAISWCWHEVIIFTVTELVFYWGHQLKMTTHN